MKKLIIFTDGACINNPGKGSWAFSIRDQENRKIHFSGFDKETTNNRMELMAVIKCLEVLTKVDEDFHLTIHSDSKYVVDGMNSWVYGWLKKAFKGVKNPDLWKLLFSLSKHERFKNVEWVWVRGHNGNVENEFVDSLCSKVFANPIQNCKKESDFMLELVNVMGFSVEKDHKDKKVEYVDFNSHLSANCIF